METQVLHDCDLYQLHICFLSFPVLGQPGVPEEYHTYPTRWGGMVCKVSACLMLPHHFLLMQEYSSTNPKKRGKHFNLPQWRHIGDHKPRTDRILNN